jgi:hypothetical protein
VQKYIGARFTLTRKDAPHAMCFWVDNLVLLKKWSRKLTAVLPGWPVVSESSCLRYEPLS